MKLTFCHNYQLNAVPLKTSNKTKGQRQLKCTFDYVQDLVGSFTWEETGCISIKSYVKVRDCWTLYLKLTA